MRMPAALAIAFCISLPSIAQTAKPGARDSARESATKRCKENRGIDCESKEGLREWLREERPISDEERQAVAAGRRHREECARNKKNATC